MAIGAGMQTKLGFRTKSRLKYLLIIFREIRYSQFQNTGECRSSDGNTHTMLFRLTWRVLAMLHLLAGTALA